MILLFVTWSFIPCDVVISLFVCFRSIYFTLNIFFKSVQFPNMFIHPEHVHQSLVDQFSPPGTYLLRQLSICFSTLVVIENVQKSTNQCPSIVSEFIDSLDIHWFINYCFRIQFILSFLTLHEIRYHMHMHINTCKMQIEKKKLRHELRPRNKTASEINCIHTKSGSDSQYFIRKTNRPETKKMKYTNLGYKQINK